MKAVGVRALSRKQLVDAISQVQHFCPPRPSRQDKETLAQAVWEALRSDRYCAQMVAALSSVGMANASGYLPRIT